MMQLKGEILLMNKKIEIILDKPPPSKGAADDKMTNQTTVNESTHEYSKSTYYRKCFTLSHSAGDNVSIVTAWILPSAICEERAP